MDDNQKDKQKARFYPVLIIISAVTIVSAAVFLLGSKNINSSQNQIRESISTPEKGKQDNKTIAADDIRVIEIEAGSFYFNPKEIRVKKGEKVKIVLKSVSMMHNFVIDELNMRIPITKAGQTSTIEFTLNRVGEFEYYCSVGQHRQMGQIGKLLVE